MNTKIDIKSLGLGGVNVDKNPLELDDNELIQSQNAVVEVTSGRSSLRKRQGLTTFTSATGGVILGGVGVQLADNVTGTRLFFIGRGTV